MKRLICLLILTVAAVAYAGDAPIRWKHAPDGDTTVITSGTTAFASDADLVFTTAGNQNWTYDYTPNVTIAPAAVRFERGMVICPHCQNEYNSKTGKHTIFMDGTGGTFETCIDAIITLLNNNRAGQWISPEEDDD